MKILISFFVFSTLYVSGAVAQSDKISRRQAIADIDTMIRIVYETHPDMYHNIPEEEFLKFVDQAKESLPDYLEKKSLYKYAGHLLPLLGDGHTSMSTPIGWTDPVFPVQVTLRADSIAVVKDTGDEIISINGIPIQELTGRILGYMSGESLAYRRVFADFRFPYMARELLATDRFEVIYRDKDLPEVVMAVPLSELRGGAYPAPWVNYSYNLIPEKSTAVLDFRGFEDEHRFKNLLDSMFVQMDESNIENLIIDIRDNGGGNSNVGKPLFQYISPSPFAVYGSMTVRYSPHVRRAYPDMDIEGEDGIYEFDLSGSLQELEPNPLRFAGKGNVFLLTSNETFSSASDFAWCFQYFDMGTIVGEETGGFIVCFGDVLSFSMPYSGLTYNSSFKKFYGYGATDEHTRPVLPDYEVPADGALEFVLKELIH